MKLTALFLFACFAVACNNAGSPVPQNSAAAPAANDKPQTAIAHSLENQTPSTTAPSGEKSKWTQSGDPIDTAELDRVIAPLEKAMSGKPNNSVGAQLLSAAYFKRAEALTGARQYASALGDYRRALKYDPSNAEAKDWIDRIIQIYDSINREYPKEGEEPPPRPFKKGGKD